MPTLAASMLVRLASRFYRDGMTEPPRPPSESFGSAPSEPPTQPAAPVPPPSPGYSPPPSYSPPPGGATPPSYGTPASYGAPPPGYGGTPPGYGAPPPPGFASGDDKTWALVAHFGGAAGVLLFGWGGFVAPLVALLAKGGQSPTVRAHAVRALNFQLTWLGASIVLSLVLCCATAVTLGIGAFGFVLLVVPYAIGIIFGILGGIRANEGTLYDYPMTISLIK